jgi:hypothetical protein
MILPRRNVEKHVCDVVPVIGVPALLVLFEMLCVTHYPW